MTRQWTQQAACSGMPTEYWFPSTVGWTSATQQVALAVCKSCPVQFECLQHATEEGEYWGIWGGTTEGQRREMRRRAAGKRGRSA